MSTAPPKDAATNEPLPAIDKGHQLATTGLVISAIGFGGWLLVLTIIFSIPKEESIRGSNNALIELNNLINYLLQVLVGLFGLSINGTLSLIGTVISLSASSQTTSPKATTGLVLGLAGLAIGAALVFWRMSVWGVFGA